MTDVSGAGPSLLSPGDELTTTFSSTRTFATEETAMEPSQDLDTQLEPERPTRGLSRREAVRAGALVDE